MNPVASLADRVTRLLAFRRDGEGVTVTIDLEGDLPLGLRVHHGERDSCLRTALRRSGGEVIVPGRQVRFPPTLRGSVETLGHEILDRLLRIARKPVSRKVVELPAMTSAERTSWTERGLLRQSGSARIARGAGRIALPTYSPTHVEQLARKPCLIESWQAQDTTQ